MKLEQLEKFLDAGFTKDEIFTLIGEQPETNPDITPPASISPETPETTPPETPETTPPETPEIKPPETVNHETENRLTAIEKSITDLIKAVQVSNVKNDSFGSSPDSLEEQTDRIMKSIIRPEIEKKEGK